MAQSDLVDGRYRLLERLGAGGTWLAKDELLGRRVAIREVADESAGLPAVARLDHPGIIHVFDLIRWRDAAWIVTEFVPSGSLHDAAPLTHRAAARVGLEAMAALRAAHEGGLRHGNLKPQNILLADDGRVILSDFGGTAADLPALGAALRVAVAGRPGALDPVIDALLDDDPARHVEPLLRGLATERSIGVFPRAAVGRATPTPLPVLSVPARVPSLITAPSVPARVPSRPPRRRLARSTRVTLLVAASLLVGTAGTALALDATSPPAPPAQPAPQAPICDDRAAAGAAVGTDQIDHRYALPSGWLWHRDPTGFVVAVPQGWTQATNGAATCFRDPDGSRSFEVAADAPVPDSPLAQWQAEERSALNDGSLPGYRRVALAAVDRTGGGADWEFTWQPAAGVRQHERRLLLAKGGDRAYVVAWSTRDQDWSTSEPLLQLIVASLS